MHNAYMSFPDGTEVTYSDMDESGVVGVRIVTPVPGGLKSARCRLPSLEWDCVVGFTDGEMEKLTDYVRRNAGLILDLSQERTSWADIVNAGCLPASGEGPSINPMLARLDALRERTPKAPCLSNMTPGDVKKELETRG